MKCEYCGRDGNYPCRSTRDMEDANEHHLREPLCRDALMRLGGGEYTMNRLAAADLAKTSSQGS